MTIIQIKYFLESVDCGSLKKASEKLYISHQALSKQIKSVENELEVELFDRSDRKNLTLTEEGKVFYTAWKEALSKHDEALDIMKQIKMKEKTSIVVGIQAVKKTQLDSMTAFAKYIAANADIDFEYKLGTPKEIREMLENNEIDMAVLFSPSVERNDKYRFLLVDEHIENPVIVVSVENPLSKRKNLSLKDIENETIIMIDNSYSRFIEKRMRRDFISNNIDPKNIKIVRDPYELMMALVMNKGVALTYQDHMNDVKDKVKMFPFDASESNLKIGTMIIWKDKKLDSLVNSIGKFF